MYMYMRIHIHMYVKSLCHKMYLYHSKYLPIVHVWLVGSGDCTCTCTYMYASWDWVSVCETSESLSSQLCPVLSQARWVFGEVTSSCKESRNYDALIMAHCTIYCIYLIIHVHVHVCAVLLCFVCFFDLACFFLSSFSSLI